ncbi:E3 ubiquitin-protein ligase RNFT1 isoform X2 [Hyla sarda]|uniref:E3 ubiquitin-protein ligase RNFT1 isoform X2 n=1 Tax=Hyla sarda TaxID=327740 RepID=UPI0024C26066|nr:E3 ubiquitin-protein ligase RNFT1 isoform X2 [Hyla sarda]
MGVKNYCRGLQSEICVNSSRKIYPKQSEPCGSASPQRISRQASCGTCSTRTARSRYLLTRVSSPKSKRKMEIDHRFTIPKSIFGKRKVPHGKCEVRYSPSPAGRLDGFSRFNGRLSSRPHTSKVQEISEDSYTSRSRNLPFSVSGHALWSNIFTMFMKIAVTVVAALRLQRIQVVPYLDDWLLIATTQEILLQQLQTTLNLLKKLGFILNPQKSELLPTTRRRFLGMIIDSQCQKVFLPLEKQERIILQVSSLIKTPFLSIRKAMQILGLMTAIDAVPYARAHIRDLQKEILTSWDKVPSSLEATISLSSQTRLNLRWWLQENNLNKGKSFKLQDPLVITTDASRWGWSAHFRTQWVQGTWSREETQFSSNLRELRAIRLAIIHFSPQIENSSVLIQSDNLVSVYYI